MKPRDPNVPATTVWRDLRRVVQDGWAAAGYDRVPLRGVEASTGERDGWRFNRDPAILLPPPFYPIPLARQWRAPGLPSPDNLFYIAPLPWGFGVYTSNSGMTARWTTSLPASVQRAVADVDGIRISAAHGANYSILLPAWVAVLVHAPTPSWMTIDGSFAGRFVRALTAGTHLPWGAVADVEAVYRADPAAVWDVVAGLAPGAFPAASTP